MTAPSKAAMDAAEVFYSAQYQTRHHTRLATAFDAFAASQSAELLEALGEIADMTKRKQLPLTLMVNDTASAAIRAAKGGQS